MWRKIRESVNNVVNRLINKSKKNRNQEFGDELEDELQNVFLYCVDNDMQMQIDGNWVSKSLIEAISAKTSKEKLLKVCRQTEAYRLETIISKEVFNRMEVLCSGCYSEVLKLRDLKGEIVVFKISLINRVNKEGNVIQSMTSIVSDVINSKRLSDLKSISIDSANHYCENFANITNCYYVWTNKSVFNKSEVKQTKDMNRKYEYFISQQTFGGRELDSITGLSPTKGLSLSLQLIASLAVAEEAMCFEHRDLHCSNILVNKSQQKYADYVISGEKFSIKLNGIKLVIIDTTFSRTQIKIAINSDKEVVKYFYNDLSALNLEDYPNKDLKKVYLRQNEITEHKWKEFCPKTNIIWLSYCINKICDKVNNWCEKHSFDSQTNHYNQLKRIKQNASNFDSAKSFAQFCQLI